MPEHFPKSTVEASYWCNPCGKRTPHRIDNGRLGPCLVCVAKREAGAAENAKRGPAAVQIGLFGEAK